MNGLFPRKTASTMLSPRACSPIRSRRRRCRPAGAALHFEKMGHFYFFGGLFALLFAVQAFAFWIYGAERSAWAQSWWVPCGLVALLMVMGEPAYLWKGLAALPMSKFFLRYTFRFYPWLAFCAILAGGLILERIMAALRRPRVGKLSLERASS